MSLSRNKLSLRCRVGGVVAVAAECTSEAQWGHLAVIRCRPSSSASAGRAGDAYLDLARCECWSSPLATCGCHRGPNQDREFRVVRDTGFDYERDLTRGSRVLATEGNWLGPQGKEIRRCECRFNQAKSRHMHCDQMRRRERPTSIYRVPGDPAVSLNFSLRRVLFGTDRTPRPLMAANSLGDSMLRSRRENQSAAPRLRVARADALPESIYAPRTVRPKYGNGKNPGSHSRSPDAYSRCGLTRMRPPPARLRYRPTGRIRIFGSLA